MSSVLQAKTTMELRGEQDPIFKDSEAESDCLSDQAAALEEQRVISCAKFRQILRLTWFDLPEWCDRPVRAGMYRRWPVSTGAVLPIDRLLLVRARGHWQEHSRHVNEGQATPV